MARKSSINREKVQQRADKFIQKGKLADAINELKLLVEDNPGDMNTVNKIGDLYVRLGKVPEAINEFTKIAESYCDGGFVLKAIAIYKKINKLDPANIPIYRKLADLYLTQGLTMEAKSQYQVIAEHYYKEGDIRESLEVYAKVIELDPNNIKIRAKVADIYQKEGLADKALHEYLVIGHKLLSKGMFREALAVFDRARKIDEHNGHALKGMAVAYTEEGQPDQAIPMLRALLLEDPQNLEMMELLAKNLLATNQLPECEKVLLALYESDPGSRDRLLELYQTYLKGNEVKSAFRCLAPILPSIVDEGAVDVAIGYVKEILRRTPRYVPALEALAGIYESRDEEVELIATRALLADAYVAEGQKEKAAELYRELLRTDPMNAQYAGRLAELGVAAPAGRAAPPPPRPAPPPAARPVAPPPAAARLELRDEAPRPPASREPARPAAPDDEEVSFEVAELAEVPTPITPPAKSKPVVMPLQAEIEIPAFDMDGEGEPAAVEEVAMDMVDFSTGGADDLAIEGPAEFPDGDPFATPAAEPEVTELAPGEVDEIQMMESFEIEAAEPVPDFERPRAFEPGSEVDDEEAKFVAEHVTEAEVFAKYGLLDRAIDQLKTVTARYPESLEAHQRLRDLMLDKQDPGGAATESILIADIYRKRGNAQMSRQELTEAARLAPNHPLLQASLSEAPAPAPPPRPAPAPTPPPPAAARPAPAPAAPPRPPAPAPPPASAAPSPPPAAAPRPSPPAPAVPAPEPPARPQPPPPPASRPAATAARPPAPAPEPPPPPKPATTRAGSQARRNDDLLASLEAQVKRPAPKADPLKAVDALFSSVSAPARGRPAATPAPAVTVAAPAAPLAAAKPAAPAPPVEAAPAPGRVIVRAEEPGEIVDEALSDVFGDEQRFMDLAGDLNSDLASLVSDGSSTVDEAPESDAAILSDIFNEFKKGVDEQLGADDYETRYNLGIAYKEMGLVDEAIREFQVASADRARAVECCSMLGLCFMEKGDPESAVSWFEKGIGTNGQSPEQLLGLHFDLAQALEMMGDRPRALEQYRKVQSKSPGHRNVSERIRRLETGG